MIRPLREAPDHHPEQSAIGPEHRSAAFPLSQSGMNNPDADTRGIGVVAHIYPSYRHRPFGILDDYPVAESKQLLTDLRRLARVWRLNVTRYFASHVQQRNIQFAVRGNDLRGALSTILPPNRNVDAAGDNMRACEQMTVGRDVKSGTALDAAIPGRKAFTGRHMRANTDKKRYKPNQQIATAMLLAHWAKVTQKNLSLVYLSVSALANAARYGGALISVWTEADVAD